MASKRRRSQGGPGPLAAVPEDASTAETAATVEESRQAYYGDRLVQYAASGIPVKQGARLLEIPETSARRYYKQALADMAGLTDEDKRELLKLDLETIRLLIQAHMPRAMKGSIGSGNLVLLALKRRADMVGLDAALQVNISNQAISDAVEDIQAIIADAAPMELPALPALPPMPGEQQEQEATAG